jgi:hypothetical protein
MNVIGIDYQQTLSVLALHEGRGDAAAVTSIGDGRRIIVPHAVLQTGGWGSDALREPNGTCLQPLDPLRDGPWLDAPGAGLFWQGLYARLVGYLGRVKPTLANGYRIAIALQGADWSAAQTGVLSLCAQAGLGKNDPGGLREAVAIPATEALLCRWLAGPADFAPTLDPDEADSSALRAAERTTLPDEAWIGVVAVGDSSTLVGAYRIERDRSGHARIAARPEVLQHLPVGLSVWQGRLLREVTSRLSEASQSGVPVEVRDAALDFAWQLTRASAYQELTWQGAGHERMYASLCLTRAECERWPEAVALQSALTQALTRAAGSGGKARRIDRILVGGIGALWPFAAGIARRVAPVWSTTTPQTDIAFGAASWLEASGDVLHLAVTDTRIETVVGEHAVKPPAAPRKPPSPLPFPPTAAPKTYAEAAQEVPTAPPVPVTSSLPERKEPAKDLPPERKNLAKDLPHGPVDGDEWNEPEPGLIPPWERE